MKSLRICLLLLLFSSPVLAQDTFVVDARTNCGAQISSVGVSRFLTAGTHTFTMSGAWTPFGSNNANSGNSWGSYMYVRIAATGVTETFTGIPTWSPTPADADAAADGLIFSFNLDTDSLVYFYNPDAQLNNNNSGICGDNRGSITVVLDGSPVAAEQSSWGVVKAIYR